MIDVNAQWLSEELVRRRHSNPQYSLRAFARSLGIGPGRLSEYLSGQRRITPAMKARLSERLLSLEREPMPLE